MEIKGKTALVTGSTGGLGWRICSALADHGARLCMVYQNSKDKAEANRKELAARGCPAVAVQADVTTQAGIDAMFGAAVKAFGGVDILVLDAALNMWIPFAELEKLDETTWNTILNYNLTAPYLAARAAAPIMKARGAGRIVTVSSIAGLSPSGSSIAYAVSKAALIHLTRCLAVALAPAVLVNCVAPGIMDGTRMTENLAPEYAQAARDTSLLKRAADKDDVAAAVLMMIGSDSITGQTLAVDAGKVFH
jgi:3-oxoacyl-[acyl-carrier protein] reductase